MAGLSAAPTVQSVPTELGIPSERESIARPGTTSLLENEVAESGEGTTGQQYVPTILRQKVTHFLLKVPKI